MPFTPFSSLINSAVLHFALCMNYLNIDTNCYIRMRVRLSVKVKVAQLCLTLCKPMDYIVHGTLQAGTLEWVAFPFSGGSSQPQVEPRSPTLQKDSLPAEPPGKLKNTGVGSLSLLQWIFLTQESNRGLLHCRQIFYPLSYQGSPNYLA